MSYLAILGFILAILLIIISIKLYSYYYKRNMNRALTEEATQGLFEPGRFILIVTIIIILILGFMSNSKINFLDGQLQSIKHNLINTNQTYNNLTYRISQLESFIEEYFESQELVQNINKEVIDLTDDDKFVYAISLALTEKDTTSTVKLIVQDNLGVTTEYPLTSSTLSYIKNIELEKTKTYELFVLIEGTTIIQEKLLDIDVPEDLDSRLEYYFFPFDDDIENEKTTLQFEVRNTWNSIDELEIQSVVFKVYEGDTLLTTITNTEPKPNNFFNQVFISHYTINIDQLGDISAAYIITDNSGNIYEWNTGF